MKIIKDNGAYKWTFQNVGGATRVKIQSGEDIRHLGELDQKMWTVLSCPIKGLEIDEKSLQYMDADGDQKIHVNDVIKTAQWLTTVLKDADKLLEGNDTLLLSDINQDVEEGKKLFNSAREILHILGKKDDAVSVADSSDSLAIFAQAKINGDGVITEDSTDDESLQSLIKNIKETIGGTEDRSGKQGINQDQIEAFFAALEAYMQWLGSKPELPYKEDTAAALDLYNALDDKVRDFFLRAKLANFATESKSALDVQVSRIETISAANLTEQQAEISSYPIQRIADKPELLLDEPLNPAWAQKLTALLNIVKLPAKRKTIDEALWNELGASFAQYKAWQDAKAGAQVEALGAETIDGLLKHNRKEELLKLVETDKSVAQEVEDMGMVDKLTHLNRDFYTLLRNFVTLQDFYSQDKNVFAIFQAGTLIIDQRACHLCMKVTDAAAHGVMAPASGMFLIYCNCTSKFRPGNMEIVAAMTVGDTGDLMVGKHANFYDRSGLDWDATITKIIDNPISIRQAFWSPYRRLAKWVEDLINKRAAEKDSKLMAETTSKMETAEVTEESKKATAQPFDIAKFAGIFAAIGMALGMIGTMLVSVAKGFATLTWWQAILVIVAIMLLISGPSMIMAWLKLRKRNLAPLLNANGWAVNAASIINIAFGATLTDEVKFPLIKMPDPYAKKGMKTWVKWLISILVILAVVCGLWLGNIGAKIGCPSPLKCFHKTVVVEQAEVLDIDEATPTESTLDVSSEELQEGE